MRYILLIAVLALTAAGYSGYWYVLAGGIETGIARLQAEPPEPIQSLSYAGVRVTGFPYRLVANVAAPVLVLRAKTGTLTWRGPSLSAFTHPWTLDHIVANFAGEHDLELDRGGHKDGMRLVFKTAQASRVGPLDQLGRIAVNLGDADINLPRKLGVASLRRGQINIRRMPDQARGVQAALRLEHLVFPPALARMLPGARLNLVELQIRLFGKPPKRLDRATLAQWRDAGGFLEVDVLRLAWPEITLSAKGRLALDESFRLSGVLTTRLKGHAALIAYLVRIGKIPLDQQSFSQAAMELLAAANNGEVKLKLRFQDGIAWLGPLKLARLRPLL